MVYLIISSNSLYYSNINYFLAFSDERSIRKACDGMTPNPIYEGPLYEIIETACAPSQRSEEDNKESSGTTMIITHL